MIATTLRSGASLPRQTVAVQSCARCGGDHDALDLHRFARPFAPPEAGGLVWTHWAACPTNGDPILVMSVPSDPTNGDPILVMSVPSDDDRWIDSVRTQGVGDDDRW